MEILHVIFRAVYNNRTLKGSAFEGAIIICFLNFSSGVLFECFSQYEDSSFQLGFVEDISNPDLVLAMTLFGIETRRGCQHHCLAFVLEFRQTPFAEFVAVVDG